MINIKVTTCAPDWPWQRQLPLGGTDWGPFRFHIDTDVKECDLWFVFESLSRTETVECPPERTVFITGEPDSLGSYSKKFLSQFHYVVTGRNDVQHPRIIRMQQGHAWFVEKTFDELIAMSSPVKTKDVCIVTSAKAFTEGHRARLKFVDAAKERFGDRVDLYGRGLKDFDSKWNVLAPYKYSIVLENYISKDFITEKLPDAWLAYCVPFYSGCSNILDYYHPDSFVNIDIANPTQSLEIIENFLGSNALYEQSLKAVEVARKEYLLNNQFFAVLKNISQHLMSTSTDKKNSVSLSPQNEMKRFKFLRSFL